jgi:hypothetical protein
MNAEHSRSCRSAEIGDRLEVTTSFCVAMGILRRHHRDRIDNDEPNVSDSLDCVREFSHILRRIKRARRDFISDIPDEMDAAQICA